MTSLRTVWTEFQNRLDLTKHEEPEDIEKHFEDWVEDRAYAVSELKEFQDIAVKHLPYFCEGNDAEQLDHEFKRMAELHADELTNQKTETTKMSKNSNLPDAITDLIEAQTRLTNAAAALLEIAASEQDDEPEVEPKKEPAKKTETKKADPKKEPAEVEEDTDTKEASALTLIQVQKAVIAVSKAHGRDGAKELIAQFTPNKEEDLKSVPADNYQDLFDAATELAEAA